MDGTNALRETTTHSLQLPNAKKATKKSGGGRERERDFSWRGLSSLALFFAIKDGETIKNWFSLSGVVCFVRVFSTHQHGIFPITNGNTERERRRREHLCRGVSILCSTCGIVQLHSIVAPPSHRRPNDDRTTTTTTGVGLSNKSSLGGFQSRGRRGRGG